MLYTRTCQEHTYWQKHDQVIIPWHICWFLRGELKLQPIREHNFTNTEQLLVTGRWFSSVAPVSSINKTDCHDIIEILLKIVLNTINQTKPLTCQFSKWNETQYCIIKTNATKCHFYHWIPFDSLVSEILKCDNRYKQQMIISHNWSLWGQVCTWSSLKCRQPQAFQ